jgi:hypothetical protein
MGTIFRCQGGPRLPAFFKGRAGVNLDGGFLSRGTAVDLCILHFNLDAFLSPLILLVVSAMAGQKPGYP